MGNGQMNGNFREVFLPSCSVWESDSKLASGCEGSVEASTSDCLPQTVRPDVALDSRFGRFVKFKYSIYSEKLSFGKLKLK